MEAILADVDRSLHTLSSIHLNQCILDFSHVDLLLQSMSHYDNQGMTNFHLQGLENNKNIRAKGEQHTIKRAR